MVESTSPLTITWEPVSFVGFNKIGFMRTDGSIPAASACMTCARPISRPSLVIKEFSAIFCDLKGATRYPSCLKILHSPAASRLLPAFDMVPCIMIVFAISVPFRIRLMPVPLLSVPLHVPLPLFVVPSRIARINS